MRGILCHQARQERNGKEDVMSPAMLYWFLGGALLIALFYLVGSPFSVMNVIIGGVPLIFMLVLAIMISREKRRQKREGEKSGVIPPEERKKDI